MFMFMFIEIIVQHASTKIVLFLLQNAFIALMGQTKFELFGDAMRQLKFCEEFAQHSLWIVSDVSSFNKFVGMLYSLQAWALF